MPLFSLNINTSLYCFQRKPGATDNGNACLWVVGIRERKVYVSVICRRGIDRSLQPYIRADITHSAQHGLKRISPNDIWSLRALIRGIPKVNSSPHRSSRMTRSAITYNKIGLSRLIHITFSVGIVPDSVTLIRLFCKPVSNHLGTVYLIKNLISVSECQTDVPPSS